MKNDFQKEITIRILLMNYKTRTMHKHALFIDILS